MTKTNVPAPIEELSISGTLTERGLKGAVRSRAAVAIDRLVGNFFGIPNAHLEAHIKKVEAKADVERQIIEEQGKATLEKVRAGQGDEVMLQGVLLDYARLQSNQEAVAAEALEQLALMAPGPDEAQDDNAQIDDDWLNVFSEHAKRASSDALRKLWGRVLAGEIRKPSSFCLTTLRVTSELDQEMAKTFQEAVRTRSAGGFIPKPKPSEMVGDILLKLTFLEEVGLLQEVGGFLGINLKKREDYVHWFTDPTPGKFGLRIKAAGDLRIGIIRITRVGRELASILPDEPPETSLRAVADQLSESAETIEMVQLAALLPDGRMQINIIKRLK